MNRIVIEVSRGMVVDAYHTEEEVEVVVIDWDAVGMDESEIPTVIPTVKISDEFEDISEELEKLS